MKNLKQLIEEAEKKKIAIGHFNVSTLEQLKAIVEAARNLKVAVIIGVSEGERDFIGARQITSLIQSFKKEKLSIFLNADHTHSLEKVKEAARLGFDAILFDAAKLPFKENISLTKQAVKIAKSINKNILVEGELGYIGDFSQILKSLPKKAAIEEKNFTKPDEAKLFVEQTGVDLLAPAVGNIHGILTSTKNNIDFAEVKAENPRLDIKRIKEIKRAIRIPLVLHGGSGIGDKDFLAAIDAGISIIHISTEIRLAWRRGLKESLAHHRNELAPYKILPSVINEIKKIVIKRLKLFNKI